MATIFRPPYILRTVRVDFRVALTAQDSVEGPPLLLLGKDTFFGGPGKAPVYDWPNPRGATPNLALKTHLDPLKLNLRGKDTFFGAPGMGPDYDWPNPRGATPSILHRTHVDPVKLALLGKDKFFAAAGEGPVYDWPNPRGPGERTANRTHLDPVKLSLLGKDTFFAAAGEAPRYDWPNPRAPAGRTPDANRAALTFAAPPLGSTIFRAPLVLSHAAPPSQAATRAQPDQRSLALQLTTAPAPFNQDDYPNPRARPYPVSGLSHLEVSIPGEDVFYGASGEPPSPNDFPNPRPAGRLLPEVGASPFLLLLRPFSQGDHPVPRGAVPAISLKTWTQPLNLELLGKDQFFAAAGQAPRYDWPNPQIARRLTPEVGAPVFFLLLRPVTPVDWPNPVLRPYSMREVGQGAPLALTAFPVVDVFRGPTQFRSWRPDPGPAVLAQAQAWQNLQSTLLAATPFGQDDWPVPRGPVASISLRTHIDVLRQTLLGKDRFFGAAGQGPVFDYPNPRAAGRLTPEAGAPSFAVVQVIPPSPFAQDAWPNPAGPARRAAAFEAGAPPFLTLQALGVAPFAQVDWPVPRGFTPSYALKTHLDAVRLNLIGKDRFFAAPGMGPTYAWPNPLIQGRLLPDVGASSNPGLHPPAPPPPFWTALSPTSGLWTVLPPDSQVWTPLPPSPKTWTRS